MDGGYTSPCSGRVCSRPEWTLLPCLLLCQQCLMLIAAKMSVWPSHHCLIMNRKWVHENRSRQPGWTAVIELDTPASENNNNYCHVFLLPIYLTSLANSLPGCSVLNGTCQFSEWLEQICCRTFTFWVLGVHLKLWLWVPQWLTL